MYTNYYSYPSSTREAYATYPTTSSNYSSYTNDDDDRFLGVGLLAPFLLGGIAGAAIANNRPGPFCCPQPMPYPMPYPYYPYQYTPYPRYY